MKVRLLSAVVYLMGGLLALTLAVSFASWVMRPSMAQEIPQGEAPPAENVMPPPEDPQGGMPGPEIQATPAPAPEVAMPPPPPPPENPTAIEMPPPQVPTSLPQPNAAGTAAATLNLPARDFLEPYIFDAREGRRNPFRPISLAGDESTTAALGPATPLERYEVDELRLLAIMWDVRNPRAMLMDPNKEIHVVGKDDRIGRKKGYIATIREGEIVIVETSEFNGEAVYSTRIMQIQKN